jgi:hypothetical protein
MIGYYHHIPAFYLELVLFLALWANSIGSATTSEAGGSAMLIVRRAGALHPDVAMGRIMLRRVIDEISGASSVMADAYNRTPRRKSQ